MKYIITFIFSLFIAFGLLAIYHGIKGYFNLEKKVEWEKTEATITDIKLLVTGREKKDSLYEFKIDYEYFFNGKKYNHQQIEKTNKENYKRHALEYIFPKLKKAKTILISVHPTQPNNSTIFPIQKQHPSDSVGLIHFGFVFLVLPVGILILFWGVQDLETDIFHKIKMLN